MSLLSPKALKMQPRPWSQHLVGRNTEEKSKSPFEASRKATAQSLMISLSSYNQTN
jgi:hypothetical protein